MSYRRDQRDGRDEKPQYPVDRRKKHQEVQQIKKDLINYGKTSWGREWIRSILSVGRPFRMQRGIDYADDEERIGNLSILKGQVFATVQGTAPSPYRVKVKFTVIPDESWTEIIKELSEKPLNLIQLLEGKLPEDIIQIFKRKKFPLFVDAEKEGLNAECSCPDKEVPCKHIAATILYVARVLDYNPFILLDLRGKKKNELLQELSLIQGVREDIEQESSKIIPKKDKNIEFSFDLPGIKTQELSDEQASTENDYTVSFKIQKPKKIIDTLENLGLPPNIENPKAFEKVFEAIYRKASANIYLMSMKSDKK